MTVQRLVGFEIGDTSEIVGLGPGCTVVAAPGSGNAGAYSFRNASTDATESALVAGLGLSRVRGSIRFYVGANPSAESYYAIYLRGSGGELIADLFLQYDTAVTGGGVDGWWFGLWDSTDTGPYWANYVTPGSNPVLGWVTFEFDIAIGATSTVHDVWYTRDADGIRYKIGATGNGTDSGGAPSSMNMGTVNVDKITTKWINTSLASEPYYLDDLVVDDAALPGDARVIARQWISTASSADSWEKSTASTIDTVWNNTPFNSASWARGYLVGYSQLAKPSLFSATQSGKGSGAIDASDVVLGWKFAMVAKAANVISVSPPTELGTSQSGSSTAGGNVTLTFSVAPVCGDVVIVWGGFGTAGANSPGISTAGYTNLLLDTATASRKFGIWAKTMGPTPDTGVVCLGSGAAGDGVAYGSIVLRSTWNSGILDASLTSATGNSINPDPPVSGGSVSDNPLALAFGASAVNDANKGTQTNYTQLASPTANATRPFSTTASKRQLASFTAGSTENPPAWGGGNSWSTGAWIAATALIRPVGMNYHDCIPAVYFDGTAQAIGANLTTTDSVFFFDGHAQSNPTPTLAQLDSSEWGIVKGSGPGLITCADVWGMVAYRVVLGATFNDTVAETAAVADAQTGLLTRVGAVTESIAAADSQNASEINPVTTTETIAAVDTQNAATTRVGAFAETAAIADATNATHTRVGAVAESVAATDVQASLWIGTRDVPETVAVVDAPNAATVRVGAAAETIAVVDAPNAATVRVGATTETVVIVDAQDAATARVGAVAETIATTTDATNATTARAGVIAETVAAVDGQSSIQVFASILVAETNTIAEVVTGEVGTITIFNGDVAEAALVVDSTLAASIVMTAADAEAASVVDATTAAMVRLGAVTETAAIADAQNSALVTTNVAVAETASTTDAQNATKINPVVVAESVLVADAQSSLWIGTGAVTETIAAADSANAISGAFKSVAETVAVADVCSATHIQVASVAESVSAVDAPSATAIYPNVVAESASVSDTQSSVLAIFKAIAESAIIVDSSNAIKVITKATAEVLAAADEQNASVIQGETLASLVCASIDIRSAIEGAPEMYLSVNGIPALDFAMTAMPGVVPAVWGTPVLKEC